MVSARWFEEEVMGQPSCARIVVVIFEMLLRMVKTAEPRREEIRPYL